MWIALIGAAALGLGSFGAACGGDDGSTSESTTVPGDESTIPETMTTPETTTTPEITTTTTAAPAEMTLVNVYWGSTVLNPVEQTMGMGTSIPPDTSVLGVVVDGTTATVDLSAEFTTSSGSLGETMRLAQVVFAVTQFDGIDRVKFHIDGVAQDPILSHGFVVGDGFTRDAFENVRPSILIEQPFPGAEVTNPLVIRGESNTFEATVRYAITWRFLDGVLVTEGFTTATGGNGIWGSFEVIVDLSEFSSDYESGPGSIIMWEDSARDGSRLDVVEVPIVLPEL